MAKKQGICRNIDCDNYKQVVEIEAGEEFECPLCHQHLDEVEKKQTSGSKTGNKNLIAIIAGVVILLAIIIGLFSLFGGQKIEKFTLDKDNISLKPGQTEKISVEIEPEDIKPELIWASSDESVASVVDGVITAKSAGKVTVSVAVKDYDNLRATCECVVYEEDVDMETLDILEDPLVLRPGGHQQLTVKFTPEDQNETISWSSSDESIATVSPRGKVDAVKVGAVLIIAKSDRTGIADTAKVSVEGPAEMPESNVGDTKAATPAPAPTPKAVPTTKSPTPTQSKPTKQPTPATKPAKSAASGSKNLGYATFKGSWPNDVNGRMIFNSSHVIDSKDPKKRVAEAGDYVIGEWADGHLVQGIWYGANNQVKGSVIIGR